MIVLRERPPLFDEIVAAFPDAAKPGTIFTWGDRIYVPNGGEVTLALRAHELVHCERQKGAPETWWLRYLADQGFRLDEEIPAHRAEYRAFKRWSKDGNAAARYLQAVAVRLSGPLYGGLISPAKARALLLA